MLKHTHTQQKQHLLCDGRGLHSEQPLDIVCTSPLCRENPLACSVCFDEKHKYHKVVALSKFVQEFARQSKNFDRKSLDPQIHRVHKSARAVCSELREKVNQRLDQFERDIDEYAEYLLTEFETRQGVLKLVGLQASPERMAETINLDELRRSVKFILNNSKFDDQVNLSKIASPLQANNQRIQSLLSKLEYISFDCLRRVEIELEKMGVLSLTIQQEKRKSDRLINHHSAPSSKVDIRGMNTLESTNVKNLNPQLQERSTVTIKPFLTPSKSNMIDDTLCTTQLKNHPILDLPQFKFTLRHPDLSLNKYVLKSNVYGKEAHFALATPSIEEFPSCKWAIRILNCRDIFCNNSLAIGLCHLSEIKSKHLASRANDFTDCYMLNSFGQVLTPTSLTTNPEMKFTHGDLLEFAYDSSFSQLDIKNEKGNIISITTQRRQNDPLYICVRMTFQNDSIELINI